MKNCMKQGALYGCIMAGTAVLLMPSSSMAKVQGQCAECHTMHNSQGGLPVALDDNGVATTTPYDILLNKNCTACHTGTNTATGNVPYVMGTIEPTYGADGTGTGPTTLAGGSFWWVSRDAAGVQDDAMGHNVIELANTDGALGLTPPGGNILGAQLTCAGTNGCHGTRAANTSPFAAIAGSHHADDTDINGNSVATSYRFLDGILGIEDSSWEYQATSTEHNQYYGVDRGSDATDNTETISSLCAQCHNDFHNSANPVGTSAGIEGASGWGSPWVRHPTDFDMGNVVSGEYGAYGGAANNYVPSAPVASSNLANGVLSTVTFTDDTIVTCISCHRAHGTPYADLLRWDYATIEAGSGTNTGGCFECHTTKF